MNYNFSHLKHTSERQLAIARIALTHQYTPKSSTEISVGDIVELRDNGYISRLAKVESKIESDGEPGFLLQILGKYLVASKQWYPRSKVYTFADMQTRLRNDLQTSGCREELLLTECNIIYDVIIRTENLSKSSHSVQESQHENSTKS